MMTENDILLLTIQWVLKTRLAYLRPLKPSMGAIQAFLTLQCLRYANPVKAHLFISTFKLLTN